jgi:hypothetical protein
VEPENSAEITDPLAADIGFDATRYTRELSLAPFEYLPGFLAFAGRVAFTEALIMKRLKLKGCVLL